MIPSQDKPPTGAVSAEVPGYAARATQPPGNGDPGAERAGRRQCGASVRQSLSHKVCAFDRQRRLSGAPSLNSARRDIKRSADSRGSAAKLADDNLHHGSLCLRRSGVDDVGQPHNPAARRHKANNAGCFGSHRHGTRRKRGSTLNPSVKITDRRKVHSVDGWGSLLSSGGVAVFPEHVVDVAVKCDRIFFGLSGLLVCNVLFAKCAQRSNLLVGHVKNMLPLGCITVPRKVFEVANYGPEVVSNDAFQFFNGFENKSSGGVSGVLTFSFSECDAGGGDAGDGFHGATILRKKFVERNNYLRKSFVSLQLSSGGAEPAGSQASDDFFASPHNATNSAAGHQTK
jgi:hypothetical protein